MEKIFFQVVRKKTHLDIDFMLGKDCLIRNCKTLCSFGLTSLFSRNCRTIPQSHLILLSVDKTFQFHYFPSILTVLLEKTVLISMFFSFGIKIWQWHG